MMKRFIAWVLVIILLVSFAVPAFAHDKAKHDEIIEYVLFGNKHYKKGLDENSEEYKCLDNLEKAVAICLDQYSIENLGRPLSPHKGKGHLPDLVPAQNGRKIQRLHKNPHRKPSQCFSSVDC